MSGAFERQFDGEAPLRLTDQEDPAVVAANSDFPAEAAVIGAILRDQKVTESAAVRLREEDFADFLFAKVFSAAVAMHNDGKTASAITIARRLENDADLIERGGATYLARLAMSDRADRGLGYIEHLVDLSRRRILQSGISELRPDIGNTKIPIGDTLAALEGVLSTGTFWSASRPAISVSDAWAKAFEEIEAIKNGTKERGIKLGALAEWNDIVGGAMMAGQLLLLGGRPGMGKTLLALAVARQAAEAGHGVLFISREMTVLGLMMRLVADLMFEEGSTATMDDVLNGRLSKHDFALAAKIHERIQSWPLVFEEPSTLNANRIGALVRRHQRQMEQRGVKLGLCVVDYLGLLDAPNNRSNREQDMSDVSREMKAVATSTQITLLGLVQLNREVEKREDKRPMLSDMRDSGSLEQDADTVVFAYRAEYYLQASEPNLSDTKKREAWELEMNCERDRLEIYSAKVRQGQPTRKRVYFFAKRQAIRNADFMRSDYGGRVEGEPL